VLGREGALGQARAIVAKKIAVVRHGGRDLVLKFMDRAVFA